MKSRLCIALVVAQAVIFSLTPCFARNSSDIIKQRERNTVSLELQITKKNSNALQRFISFLNLEPNGYATGFLVGDHLVMTAYHVVSANLDESKKLALGFNRTDELQARVYTNGCQAKILKVDQAADLALLEVCGLSKTASALTFQPTLSKAEPLSFIAHPPAHRLLHLTYF